MSLGCIVSKRISKFRTQIPSYLSAQVHWQFDNKNELTNLDLSTCARKVQLKKLPLGIKLLQKLLNATKTLQNLPNGKNIVDLPNGAKALGSGCRTVFRYDITYNKNYNLWAGIAVF